MRREFWPLHPNLDFLNHGSFGATPIPVLEAQRALRDAMERDLIEFLAPERSLEPQLDHVRGIIAELIGADAHDVAFVRNATDGINAVLRSFPFRECDEIVVTNHGYNACNNAARFAAEQCGAVVKVAQVPFPLVDSQQVIAAIEQAFSDRTRILLVDHVTSPTGLVFPIEQIVDAAHRRNIRVLVDGAHAPGMVPLDLRAIGADYYTANHHKWLCAPKASAFLWVRREWQLEVRPTVISHGANRNRPKRSRFIAEFDWQGTFDPTPILSVPAAIEFLSKLYAGGLPELMSQNRQLALDARAMLCHALELEVPAPDDMIGSLITLPLPSQRESAAVQSADAIQRWLREIYRFEVPVYDGLEPGSRWFRIALQAYNNIGQIHRLAEVLKHELRHA